MTVTVQFFAAARDAAGKPELSVDLPDGATVAELRRSLVRAVPGLSRFGPSLWVAINGDYAADTEVIPANAEIACFPPVSGG